MVDSKDAVVIRFGRQMPTDKSVDSATFAIVAAVAVGLGKVPDGSNGVINIEKDNVSVLFVCMGNICRSPSGEGVFKHYVEGFSQGRIEVQDYPGGQICRNGL